jgi:Subtilisin inhibitor-like
MRVLASLAVCLALAPAAAGASPATELRITVWPEGRDKESQTWTLRCAPAGGTLPNARPACASLAKLRQPFAPVPPDMACTEIYGGPQVALVVGRHAGRRVWARFSRTDGCQIDRWRRHAFLFAA